MKPFIAVAAALLASAAQAQTASAAIEAPVLARTVGKGEVVEADDFTVGTLAPAQARGALGPGNAAGMEAVRPLMAGAPVRSTDLIRPQLVRRGEPVTLVVRSGGLSITAQGRALASGAQGELVRVVNSATSRTLEGQVEKAGTVRIAAP